MIWFSCKQCGKVHGRSEGSSGTTIFCDCGQGVIVPWESTVAAPEKPPEPQAAPRLKPVVFESSPPPTPPPRADRWAPEGDEPEERRDRRERERPPAAGRDRRGPRDPNACLNHDNRVKQNSCADCGEGFCAMCLVTFQGKMLCGPCKNFRTRLLQKPLQVSFLSWFSVVLALVLGPLALCVLPLGASTWTVLWTLLAILPQAAAIVLAVLAWRGVEREPSLGGRGLAVTGMLAGALGVVLIVVLNFYGARWHG